MRGRLKSESGANAVEFALILPILIVLIFGIFFGGLAYNRQLALTQSAREGARFAATLPLGGATAPNQDWFDDVVERIEESSTGSLADGQPGRYICVRFVDDQGASVEEEVGDTSVSNCDVDSSAVTNRARVEVVVARPANLEFIFYNFPVTLRAQSIARYEGKIG